MIVVATLTATDSSSSDTSTAATTTAETAASDSSSNENNDEKEIESSLFITLVDTVTGKIIARIEHVNAAAPLHATLVENHIVATYWNTKVDRCQLNVDVIAVVLYCCYCNAVMFVV